MCVGMGADKASVSRSPAIIRCADVLFTILTWHFCGMTDRHTIFFASRPTGAGATTATHFFANNSPHTDCRCRQTAVSPVIGQCGLTPVTNAW